MSLLLLLVLLTSIAFRKNIEYIFLNGEDWMRFLGFLVDLEISPFIQDLEVSREIPPLGVSGS
jgi:hypothetical protein